MGARVGFVVVSHSRPLGEAVRAMAAEMLPAGGVPIEVAAGLDATTFGTDAVAISEALAVVAAAAESVVVLMDLGSAVLSAELALELVDGDVRERVHLCPAPLVEGLVVGAVAAAGGADAAVVIAEATRSLAAKGAHLEDPAASSAAAGEPAEPQATGSFELSLPHGLHARPVACLVAALADVDAQVWLVDTTAGSAAVPANSPAAVAGLGAGQGHRVEVRATGPQAQDAVDRVLALAARDFDAGADLATGSPVPIGPPQGSPSAEPARESAEPARESAEPARESAEPARESPGPAREIAAIARVWHAPPPTIGAATGDAEQEWARLESARETARERIRSVREYAGQRLGDEAAAIFDAHLGMLDDPHLLHQARAQIDRGAAVAWAAAVAGIEQQLAALEDPYLQARAADARAVGDQVLRALAGEPEPVPDVEGILVAGDVTPSQVVVAGPGVAGVLLARGSAVSHAAILARRRGLPWVADAGADVLALDGQAIRLSDASWAVS